jgi:hypothetical protein
MSHNTALKFIFHNENLYHYGQSQIPYHEHVFKPGSSQLSENTVILSVIHHCQNPLMVLMMAYNTQADGV